jgi:lipid II isoglutaminyl synthase (glutamine-hydrolysing)
MAGVKITVCYLYPDIMSIYGDRGNVETILRRCEWRNIAADVRELRLGDRLAPDEVDLIMIGGGGESQQHLVAPDLCKVKGAGIREAVAGGAAALAVGGGYELFGRFCQPERGAELRGIGLFDAWTIRANSLLNGHYDTISAAHADRVIGELVVRWQDTLLVGFENHGGGTYLGATAQPLGQVVCGHGNNGDGTEGVILGSAVGTYLRGPCLPKNPALADFLIAAAVSRRHGAVNLPPLADDLEEAARAESMRRAREAERASQAKLHLPALAQAGLSHGGHAAAKVARAALHASAQRRPPGTQSLHSNGNAQSGANR